MNRMKLPLNLHIYQAIALLSAFTLFAGCETEDEDYDHVPSPGNGSLIIDNDSDSDMALFLDGSYTSSINDGETRIIDIAPGLYRIVLDENDGNRSYRSDIDILENRLTILNVSKDLSDGYSYSVTIAFQ